MTRTLMLTYDKTNEDKSVLGVSECDLFSMNITIRNIFTGERAEQLYNELTGQNVIAEEENDNRPEFFRECFNKPVNTEDEDG